LEDLQNALKAANVSNEAMMIKSQGGNSVYVPRTHTWRTHDNFTWDVANMYEIQVSSNCQITLTGTPLNPAEHPVTIKKGSNWIGYPCQIPHDLEYALKYFNPQEGDRIKLGNGL
jgi:hypothetical protein